MATVRALTLLLAMATAWPGSARDLQAWDFVPSDHPAVRSLAFMNEFLQERLQGGLTIVRRVGNEHDTDSFVIGQVRNGTLDMARVNLAALNVSVQGSLLATLPFAFGSREEMWRALDGQAREDILAGLQREGLVGLSLYDGAARSFYSRSQAIRTVEDLKGLKVRVQSVGGWARVLQRLGAEPVVIPRAQTKAALLAGVVDAADGDWATYMDEGHYEAAPFYSLTRHAHPPSVLIMSERTWRSLSRAEQTMLREAARASAVYKRGLVDEYEAELRQRAAASGVRIHEDVDRKSFRDAMVPLAMDEAKLQKAMPRSEGGP